MKPNVPTYSYTANSKLLLQSKSENLTIIVRHNLHCCFFALPNCPLTSRCCFSFSRSACKLRIIFMTNSFLRVRPLPQKRERTLTCYMNINTANFHSRAAAAASTEQRDISAQHVVVRNILYFRSRDPKKRDDGPENVCVCM
jgi:hypothetical protein